MAACPHQGLLINGYAIPSSGMTQDQLGMRIVSSTPLKRKAPEPTSAQGGTGTGYTFSTLWFAENIGGVLP
ncbi:hypothetical protein ml_295 [Mollivirus sibericum]|uniref:hypothetical protein n=1 Tax=Mollivirus sibericum TaxID=1678078 RepID=UPI0006B2E14E|nr:hypothetical protein ml_295 [Mollivirus sibericum]ALD62097.1 hypothetical protein ml_295 [Mollivirus sibericum]